MLASDGGFTMRNRVINGCCRVKQRASVSLSTSNQFGEVDRMLGSLVGSGLGGTFIQQVAGLATGMTYKRGVKFNDISFTSGYITFRHRIESLNTLDLSGQTVTVSAKIYHDYGSNENFFIGLRKCATTADTFSATSAIAAGDVATTVPSGTTTTISATLPLGATEADLGLEVVIYHTARTVSVKNVVIGDIELQLGTEVGPFERRSYGAELALCQRYYETSRGTASTFTQASTIAYPVFVSDTQRSSGRQFIVPKRSAPTVTIYSRNNTSGKVSSVSAGTDNAGAASASGISEMGWSATVIGSAMTAGLGVEIAYTADSEL